MDVNEPHHRFIITDRSFSNMARREVTRLAESFGFSPADIGKINIIVAEMASNLAKHATQGGELLVKPLGKPVQGLEIMALDNGPGMANPVQMLEDGVSTYGSAGEGLGAMKRQSDVFDLYSQPGVGTVVLSRLMKTSAPAPLLPRPPDRYEVSSVMVAKPGETACGDGYCLFERGPDLHLLVLDGLGHGVHAQEASQLAIDTFMQAPKGDGDPAGQLRHLHEEIRRTRGAVGFLAHIDGGAQIVSYCGIGNISGKIFSTEGGPTGSSNKSLMSYNGIIGHNIPNTLHSQRLDWGRNKMLVLHSDGLKSRWELNKYPSLYRHHASIIAALLYKDNTRQTDDTLVLVVKAKNQ